MGRAPIAKTPGRTLLAALATAAALAAPAPAATAPRAAHGAAAPKPPIAAASLAGCLTTGAQQERSATFAGEMTMVAGASRMQMRIQLLERLPGEELFHAVGAPQAADWRSSAPGVKIFKYLKQVTNLSAPASYRASIRFRWQSAKGHVVRTEQLHTATCEQPAQPAPPATVTPTGASGTPSGASGPPSEATKPAA